ECSRHWSREMLVASQWGRPPRLVIYAGWLHRLVRCHSLERSIDGNGASDFRSTFFCVFARVEHIKGSTTALVRELRKHGEIERLPLFSRKVLKLFEGARVVLQGMLLLVYSEQDIDAFERNVAIRTLCQHGRCK